MNGVYLFLCTWQIAETAREIQEKSFNLYSAYRFPSFVDPEDEWSLPSPGLGVKDYPVGHEKFSYNEFGLKNKHKNLAAFLTFIRSTGFKLDSRLAENCGRSTYLPLKQPCGSLDFAPTKFLFQAGDPYTVLPSPCQQWRYTGHPSVIDKLSLALGESRSRIFSGIVGPMNCTNGETNSTFPNGIWKLSCVPWILHIYNSTKTTSKDALFSIDRPQSFMAGKAAKKDWVRPVIVDTDPWLFGKSNPLSLGGTFINTMESPYPENIVHMDTLQRPGDVERGEVKRWTLDDLMGSGGKVLDKAWQEANLQIKTRKVLLNPKVPCTCCWTDTHSPQRKYHNEECTNSRIVHRNYCYIEKLDNSRSIKFNESVAGQDLRSLSEDERMGWRVLDAWLNTEIRIPCFSTLIHSSPALRNLFGRIRLDLEDEDGYRREILWKDARTLGISAAPSEPCLRGSSHMRKTCSHIDAQNLAEHKAKELKDGKAFATFAKNVSKDSFTEVQLKFPRTTWIYSIKRGSSYKFNSGPDCNFVRWEYLNQDGTVRQIGDSLYIKDVGVAHINKEIRAMAYQRNGSDWRSKPHTTQHLTLHLHENLADLKDYYFTPVVVASLMAVLVILIMIGYCVNRFTSRQKLHNEEERKQIRSIIDRRQDPSEALRSRLNTLRTPTPTTQASGTQNKENNTNQKSTTTSQQPENQ